MRAKLRLVRFANPWSQALGLMFRKARNDTLYLFEFDAPVRHSFHMYCVFHPIDLFLLDKQQRVVEMKKGFTPFTTYKPKKPYWYAVEAAPGILKPKLGTSLRKLLE